MSSNYHHPFKELFRVNIVDMVELHDFRILTCDIFLGRSHERYLWCVLTLSLNEHILNFFTYSCFELYRPFKECINMLFHVIYKRLPAKLDESMVLVLFYLLRFLTTRVGAKRIGKSSMLHGKYLQSVFWNKLEGLKGNLKAF